MPHGLTNIKAFVLIFFLVISHDTFHLIEGEIGARIISLLVYLLKYKPNKHKL